MKIAVIAPPWIPIPPKTYGGIQQVIATLVENLVVLGHDVTLFCPPGSISRATMVHPLEQAYEDRIDFAMYEVDHVMQALEFIRDSGDFDVIHDHTTTGLAFAKYCKIPLVHTMHNGHGGDWGTFYSRHGQSAHLVAISHAQKKTAPKSIKVAGAISNPIDVTSMTFREHKRNYALWIGNFNPWKGAHLAIHAAKIIGKPLLLAGPIQSGQERYFEQQVKPHIDDELVRYVGSVGGKIKNRLFANASCMLMPITWNEPFGMVMVEALASGTPVIAFPYGAATEIVIDGYNGFQVQDGAAMAEAMTDLEAIKSSDCYSSVVDRYNPQRIAQDYVDLFEKAIGQ